MNDYANAEHVHINDGEINCYSERRLWQSVVLQAIRDALLTRTKLSGSEEVDKHQAANWLRGGSKDFNEVCSMAGLEPDAVSGWWRNIEKNLDNVTSIRASLTEATSGVGGKRRVHFGRIAPIAAE
jgi:hypothetical protein